MCYTSLGYHLQLVESVPNLNHEHHHAVQEITGSLHVPRELQGLGFMRTIIEFEAGLALPQSRASSGDGSFTQHDHNFPNITTRNSRLFSYFLHQTPPCQFTQCMHTLSIHLLSEQRDAPVNSHTIVVRRRRTFFLYAFVFTNIVTSFHHINATVLTILVLYLRQTPLSQCTLRLSRCLYHLLDSVQHRTCSLSYGVPAFS